MATTPGKVVHRSDVFELIQYTPATKNVHARPFLMLVIAEEFLRQGLDPTKSSLRIGIFGAEPWTNEMRHEIEQKMGLDAIDIYGLTEVMQPGSSGWRTSRMLALPFSVAIHLVAILGTPPLGAFVVVLVATRSAQFLRCLIPFGNALLGLLPPLGGV